MSKERAGSILALVQIGLLAKQPSPTIVAVALSIFSHSEQEDDDEHSGHDEGGQVDDGDDDVDRVKDWGDVDTKDNTDGVDDNDGGKGWVADGSYIPETLVWRKDKPR